MEFPDLEYDMENHSSFLMKDAKASGIPMSQDEESMFVDDLISWCKDAIQSKVTSFKNYLRPLLPQASHEQSGGPNDATPLSDDAVPVDIAKDTEWMLQRYQELADEAAVDALALQTARAEFESAVQQKAQAQLEVEEVGKSAHTTTRRLRQMLTYSDRQAESLAQELEVLRRTALVTVSRYRLMLARSDYQIDILLQQTETQSTRIHELEAERTSLLSKVIKASGDISNLKKEVAFWQAESSRTAASMKPSPTAEKPGTHDGNCRSRKARAEVTFPGEMQQVITAGHKERVKEYETIRAKARDGTGGLGPSK